MTKYFAVFKMALSEIAARRFDFFVWRLRHIVTLVSLYFVWSTVYQSSERFALYSRDEIMTYVFLGAGVFEAITVAGKSLFEVGAFINRGELSHLLLKPINFLRFQLFKDLADKALVVSFALVEVAIFVKLFSINLVWPGSGLTWGLTIAAVVLAVVLSFLLNLLVNLLAFWTREADGPRFLFVILRQFASGTFFPLNILPPVLFKLLAVLPFSYLVFFPAQIFLNKLDLREIAAGFAVEVLWIVVFWLVVAAVWRAGLRRYQAEGG